MIQEFIYQVFQRPYFVQNTMLGMHDKEEYAMASVLKELAS